MTERMIKHSKSDSFIKEQENHALSREIFFEMLENIFVTYEEANKKPKASEKKETSFFCFTKPSRKPVFLSDFANTYKMSVLRTLDFDDKSVQKVYNLNHIEVHKQFVYNLCGYHTLYNMIEICKLLKSQDLNMSPKELFNPAGFWKFHFECARYLDIYAKKYGYDQTKYPWQEYNIRWGDLERAYVKPLTQDNKMFQTIVQSDKNFKISYMTFGFQFKRLLYSAESLDKMQQEIDSFVQAKKTPVHHVQFIMMGVTNHWFLFFAHRYMDHVEFWVLDSKNRDYLTWNKDQIDQFLSEENEKRVKEGQSPMTDFRIWVAQNAIMDSQISIDLLVNCYLGKMTLYQFVADSEVRMLSQGLTEAFCLDPEIDINEALKIIKEDFINSPQKDSVVKKAEEFILGYHTSIRAFFIGDKEKYLSPGSKEKLLGIISLAKLILEHHGNRHSRSINGFRELAKKLEQARTSQI